MRKKSLLILSATLVVALIATLYISAPRQFYDNGVSDEAYMAVARNTKEARAFLDIYPQAEIMVDRSGKLAVDFRVDKFPVISTTQSWEGIRLRVFINPWTNRPAEMFLQCDSKFIEERLIQYLEQYAQTQSCP